MDIVIFNHRHRRSYNVTLLWKLPEDKTVGRVRVRQRRDSESPDWEKNELRQHIQPLQSFLWSSRCEKRDGAEEITDITWVYCRLGGEKKKKKKQEGRGGEEDDIGNDRKYHVAAAQRLHF